MGNPICPICGREGCLKPFTTPETCYRLGYDRSQAALAAANTRADAAIAEIVNEQRRFGEMQREAWKLEEALAAARRECDRYRTALGVVLEASGTGSRNHMKLAIEGARTALAAPGAAPDTSPATLEAWEKRLQREAEVNDPSLAAPAAGEEGK